ncbi:hypothetical protein AB447_223855 [Bacillus glycinifermentans]|uniref:MFS transporter n=2 Tax=Bacillus glycinifermentans TaxID=1664069 RepID=A0A0T6BKZ7_9BACI|nr:hypothetical protein AB447_223855 [Bacillus glycinifermentans]
MCGSGSHLIYKHAHCSGKHQRFFMWMLNFMIGFAFPVMLSSVGLSVTFFVFVALGILAIGFVYKFMPETKRRTLEELEERFRSQHNKYRSEKMMIKAALKNPIHSFESGFATHEKVL